MAKDIFFVLNGCDIQLLAKAPSDITLEQLLKQCDRIKPDWCACGIRTAVESDLGMKAFDYKEPYVEISYDSIKLVQTNGQDMPSCRILQEGESIND